MVVSRSDSDSHGPLLRLDEPPHTRGHAPVQSVRVSEDLLDEPLEYLDEGQ